VCVETCEQVFEVAVAASSSTDISALDAEQMSSWSAESGDNEAANEDDKSASRAAPSAAKVEAVTLMMTVRPGKHYHFTTTFSPSFQ